MAPAEGPAGPVDAAAARLVLPERYYAGRAVEERDGSWALMAFVNEGTAGGFTGTITDPMPLRLDAAASLPCSMLEDRDDVCFRYRRLSAERFGSRVTLFYRSAICGRRPVH